MEFTIGRKTQKIVTGRSILVDALCEILASRNHNSNLIICDSALRDHNSIRKIAALDFVRIEYVSVPKIKDMDAVREIFSFFKKHQLLRTSIVICIGGGTLGDICGFACSIYMRGIDYIQVGTTIMSQADCIVSKVAICDGELKNLYGSFHSPIISINDIDLLKSDSYDKSSLVEVIKHYLVSISDERELIQKMRSLANPDDIGLEQIIADSARIKAEIVCMDPYDADGKQKALSLGHTFANLIESQIPAPSHAEAVWIGIELALNISQHVFSLNSRILMEYNILRERLCPSLPVSKLSSESAQHCLRGDKLSRNGEISLILLKRAGEHVVMRDVPYEIIESAFMQSQNVLYQSA